MSSTNRELTIPIFPLQVVLFPGGKLPLHIFEERYRLMFAAVLSGDGLFGVLNLDEDRQMASIGCLARVVDVTRYDDGRLNIDARGVERFRVRNLQQIKPFISALVEMIDEREPEAEAYSKARELREMLGDLFRLSSKLLDKDLEIGDIWPQSPRELSFMVPASLYGSSSEQQRILEMDDTCKRLEAEKELIDVAIKSLAARTALKDALG
ncbi:MAG: LON peptidase substrate-binding domain-containing protein [Candidatus Melainabacteria bacterium]|nr:LON peptidase substrate-binding domain-containing protein [Candidatus Melainabacteria bacterium]